MVFILGTQYLYLRVLRLGTGRYAVSVLVIAVNVAPSEVRSRLIRTNKTKWANLGSSLQNNTWVFSCTVLPFFGDLNWGKSRQRIRVCEAAVEDSRSCTWGYVLTGNLGMLRCGWVCACHFSHLTSRSSRYSTLQRLALNTKLSFALIVVIPGLISSRLV